MLALVGPTLPEVLIDCPPLLELVHSSHDFGLVVEDGSTALLLVADQSSHDVGGPVLGAMGGHVQTSVIGQ